MKALPKVAALPRPGRTKMNPPFPMIQQIARDRDDEVRKEANMAYNYSLPARQRRLQERLAARARAMADQLDPEHSYGRTGSALQIIE